MPQCPICGNREFYESSGFYYCADCNVQSQEVQQTAKDDDYTSRSFAVRSNAALITTIRPDEEAAEGASLLVPSGGKGSLFSLGHPESLFVLIDVILRSQVSWLMDNAGAREPLMDVMRNVWFSFIALSLPDVKDGLPEALFHVDRWTNTLRQSDLCALVGCTSDQLSDILDFWRLSHGGHNNKENDEAESSVLVTNKVPAWRRLSGRLSRAIEPYRPSDRKSDMFPERLTLQRVVALLSIAVYLCGESILVSDIIRWIRDLQLACVDPSDVIPDNQLATYYLLRGKRPYWSISYHEVEWEISVIWRLLNVDTRILPSVSVVPLIERYIHEMNLPADLIPFVAGLASGLNLLQCKCDFAATRPHESCRRAENAEALVMSLIIYSLRLLYCLNDASENKIIVQTRKLQEVLGQNLTLFDLQEWIRYMDVRRLALFRHTRLLKVGTVEGKILFMEDAENSHYERRKVGWSRLERNQHERDHFADLHRAFKELNLANSTFPEKCVQVPPTLRPFRAHAQELENLYPVLSSDFSICSISHLIQTDRRGMLYGNVPVEAVEPCLSKINRIQAEGFSTMFAVRTYNIREEMRTLPALELLPSAILRWLVYVSAEIIEHRPESLLGEIMFLELVMFPGAVKTNQAKLNQQLDKIMRKSD